ILTSTDLIFLGPTITTYVLSSQGFRTESHSHSNAMEEGELHDPHPAAIGTEYDPSLEWPGDDPDMPSTSSSTPYSYVDGAPGPSTPSSYASFQPPPLPSTGTSSCLRLLVCRSSVLPKTGTLVVLDGYPEVRIGRDAPPAAESTPRLRLKEMEVSKLHATVYWDKTRLEWAIVDMGSMHGTYHLPGSFSLSGQASTSATRADARGTRLSPARVASVPRSLAHGDTLSIGSTTFLVHVHEGGIPCEQCSRSDTNEVPLVDNSNSSSKKRKRTDAEATALLPRPSTERNPKKAISILKRNLLSRHASPSTIPISNPSASTPYMDRSARRRALHTDSPDPPPRPSSAAAVPTFPPPPHAAPVRAPEPVSAPPTPLPSSNIGHKLLMKQGWTPGTSLGSGVEEDERIALVEPLNVSGNVKRTGLGMVAPSMNPTTGTQGWREEAKLRRWAHERTAD
ncbi:hypothetical protein EIP91_004298, partial [Steccherinum ochraceum]